MRQLSPAGWQAVNDLAARHGFSPDAIASMLQSVIDGNGSMAQFSHPEFGGSGQWMRGGMIMLSDMFNNHLKGRVDSLCSELAGLIANQPGLIQTGSFQSQSQGGHSFNGYGSGGYQSGGQAGGQGASLFVPVANWWGPDLAYPDSTGSQNGVRYAVFSQARRLAIELGGRVTIYDTLDHRIGGVGQQQSGSGSVTFTSQYGVVDVASLPDVTHGTPAPQAYAQPSQAFVQASYNQDPAPFNQAPAAPLAGGTDVFEAIEKLASLRAKGILSDAEFATKKADLLNRL